jgi:type III secretory pathway component EscS
MTRLSWHLESLAWWLLLTGMLAVYCVAVTVGMLAALFRARGEK